MAYEFSGSIALGTIVTQNVTGSSNPQSRRSGGKFSPSGTKLAVPVWVAPGSVSKIEIYQSGSSGWAMVEDFITHTPDVMKNPGQLTWLSETSLALGLRGPGSDLGVYTYVSSSDHGYHDQTHNQSVRRTLDFPAGGMLEFNPSKTLMIVYKPSPASSAFKKTDVYTVDDDGLWLSVQVPSSTTGEEYIASVEWLSDTDFAVGQPAHTEAGGGSNHGKINIYRTTDGGSSFSSIETVIGEDGDKIGASLHYHTASGGLIVGTGTPTTEAVDDNGGNKWYLYQSSSSGGYLQGTTDRTELTSTGAWSGRVPLDYNMQADETGGSVFAIQTLPSFNTANAEVLVWESGSEGWKASVIDDNVSYKTINPTSTPLVGLSKLGFVANNNDVSPTNDAADKSFRVHTLGEGCETLSEYQLSGSITCGKTTATRVLARTGTGTFGGSISPDGTMIATISERHGGSTSEDLGIDIWSSSSSGWSETDSVDTGATTVEGIMWLTNNEFIAVGENSIFSFKSGSSGWSEAYENSLQLPVGNQAAERIYPNADRTKLAITSPRADSWQDSHHQRPVRISIVTSGSAGYANQSSEVILATQVPGLADITWVDDSNIVLGFPGTNSSIGQVRHYKSGSGGWSLEAFINGSSTTGADGLRYLGSMVHYHTGSSTLLVGGAGVGAQGTAFKGYINLFPSGSSQLLPDNNLASLISTRELIDLGAQGLTADSSAQTNGFAPYHPDGISLSVDPSNADRFVVMSAIVSDTNENGRVFITVESGSLGWKFNQLNPEGNGLKKPYARNGQGHQLSTGASRYVSTLTGSVDTKDTEGFIVYDTGLSVGSGGGGSSGGGSFDQVPEITISPSSINITESGASATVTAELNFVAPPGETIEVTAIATGLDGSEFTITPATQSYDSDLNEFSKIFTITPVEDFFTDGDQGPFEVTFITQNHSTPTNKNGLTGSVNITVVDSQTLSDFTVSPNSAVIIHENSSQQFQISLPRQPTGDVAIEYGLNNLTRASIDNSSDGFNNNKTLIFNPNNWNTPQLVTVNADDDDLGGQNKDEGSISFILLGAQTTAIEYTESNNTSSLDKLINIFIEDDDIPAVNVSPVPDEHSNISLVENGPNNTHMISVVLDTEPTHPVTINISTDLPGNRFSISETSLTFSPDDISSLWSDAKSIIFTATDNQTADSPQTVSGTVTLSVSSDDVNYSFLNDIILAFDVTNDDSEIEQPDPDPGDPDPDPSDPAEPDINNPNIPNEACDLLSVDYTINYYKCALGQYMYQNTLPFRLGGTKTILNIRNQSANKGSKTFIGEQKT